LLEKPIMLHRLARVLLGRAAFEAPDLVPDIADLAAPGRPPFWIVRGVEKSRSNKAQAAFVEPFFNHDAGDTRVQRAA
jgi:hypothetical protein